MKLFIREQIFFIQKVLIILAETFIENIYQKSSLIAIIIFVFYLFHLKTKPLITNNLNKINIGCDLSLILFILIKIFSNNAVENSSLYYFTLILSLIIRLIMIVTILKWIIKISIFSSKQKIIKKFKRLEKYLENSIL